MAERKTKAPLSRGSTPRLDLAFPYSLTSDGQTAVRASQLSLSENTGDPRHLRDLLEQLLLTSPEERVMRPTFGSGLQKLIFEPAGAALAVALQAQMQATILQYLGDRLDLESLEIEAEDGKVLIRVAYRPLADGQRRVETFEREA